MTGQVYALIHEDDGAYGISAEASKVQPGDYVELEK